MHGGAAGSGGPRGNRNPIQHAAYNAEAVRVRRKLRAQNEDIKATIEGFS